MKKSVLKRTPPRRRTLALHPFWEQVTDYGTAPCVLHDFRPHGYVTECRGQLDAHHLVPKHTLRDREPLDPRNGVPVCRYHHLQLEAKQVYLHPDDLPVGFGEFLAETGNRHRLGEVLGWRQ